MRGQGPSGRPADLERGTCGTSATDDPRPVEPSDRAIAELANRQRGVVTRTQLRAIGLTRNAIDGRMRSGRLHPLYRGVYLVGHAVPATGARELGAVLVCGHDAVVSHRAAAALWKLLLSAAGDLDVTVPGRDCRRTDGIRVHRVDALERRDVRKLGGIPVTTPARTILDLAAVVSTRELERAVAEVHLRGLARHSELVALLARYPRRPGIATLRSMITPAASPALTRSEAEERFLALIRRAELSTPEVNVRIGGHEVDFLWRSQGLVVEVDGFRFHSSRAAFERDRRRDAELGARGFRVIRVTWRQIVDRPEAVIARLATAIGA
jgi:very-short-patch-repair endonuclease